MSLEVRFGSGIAGDSFLDYLRAIDSKTVLDTKREDAYQARTKSSNFPRLIVYIRSCVITPDPSSKLDARSRRQPALTSGPTLAQRPGGG